MSFPFCWRWRDWEPMSCYRTASITISSALTVLAPVLSYEPEAFASFVICYFPFIDLSAEFVPSIPFSPDKTLLLIFWCSILHANPLAHRFIPLLVSRRST